MGIPLGTRSVSLGSGNVEYDPDKVGSIIHFGSITRPALTDSEVSTTLFVDTRDIKPPKKKGKKDKK